MIRVLLAAALLATSAAPAFANDTRTVEIRYDVRDLTRPEGIRDLEARIADAAERVCELDSRRLSDRQAERRCEAETVADALALVRAKAGEPALRPASAEASTN
ncbi:UrcA family protein [Maricaulis sp.]|uniref:UrcA family protein n=1 Tax=Maricaulis sp. TaxID=1486257 RepID=UPI001B2A20A3|nr:UrcA family protein [Maricaulis sp.]MBO6766006.1 UrcA family protein [Maricaulis sp.]